jgi:hypothetical protein
LLVAAAVLAAPPAKLLSRTGRTSAALAVFCAAVALPLGGATPAEYLRGVWGDLSVTTWTLLAAAAVERVSDRQLLSPAAKSEILGLAAGAAVLLYPMALGLSAFDPYAAGYRPLFLAPVLFAYSAWARHRGSGAAWIPLAAALAFDARLMESFNLWDYLLDPLVAVYGLGFHARRAVSSLL